MENKNRQNKPTHLGLGDKLDFKKPERKNPIPSSLSCPITLPFSHKVFYFPLVTRTPYHPTFLRPILLLLRFQLNFIS
ncbi:MAG: hypothetical protein C0168_00130 [Candidatus Aminicenantes bacterium]|nr:MAG: hypothetical protein C0168_00130 [Candidatus Aminicenantes bacterium]